jgi:hypothetical protein
MTISSKVHCHLTIQSHTSKVRMLVADLGLPYDVILGDLWLKQHQAVLSYARDEVIVGSNVLALVRELVPDRVCIRTMNVALQGLLHPKS